MITFIIGLVLLVAGGFIYGGICDKVFAPDRRETPAVKFNDGVDYIPIKKWKNCIMELLTIAGTGPILGPIQGALFGPIAFITIPVGCIIAGAFHDYMIGMMSVRNEGSQIAGLVKKFLGKKISSIYNIFVCIMLLLVGTVFLYTPGDIFLSQVLNQSGNDAKNPLFWIICAVIFVYYLLQTILPIDKIIGKIYPIFSAIVLVATICIFGGIFFKGYQLNEIWSVGNIFTQHPKNLHFVPIFFVTVACGIVSGFHSTQSTLVARTLEKESDGRDTFYNMMICEGIIAMIWAAATMGAINNNVATVDTAPTAMVGKVAKDMLGNVFGIIAIIGVILLPLTSGGTALRSMKNILSDALHINIRIKRNEIFLISIIFALVGGITAFAKINSDGFNILWRYFAWANQVTAVFAFATITVYMIHERKPFLMALIPGTFYMFVVSAFILNANIGFNLPWIISYIVAFLLTIGFVALVIMRGKMIKNKEL